LADAKPTEWLAKATFWLASQDPGLGLVITAKSKPKPESSQKVNPRNSTQQSGRI
jgi:hypothetical protein